MRNVLDRLLEQAADNGCPETATVEVSFREVLLSLLPERDHTDEFELPDDHVVVIPILISEGVVTTTQAEFVGPVVDRSHYQLTESGLYVAWEIFMQTD